MSDEIAKRDRVLRSAFECREELVAYSRALLGNFAAAEDVVQEAFLELFRQPEQPQNTSAWLYKVVRNKSISARRSTNRRRHHEGWRANRSPGWFEESPENTLDASEITKQISELPDHEREVLVLRLWGELTFEEIARLTESSSSNCHRLYRKAIDQLRQKAGIPCPNSSQ